MIQKLKMSILSERHGKENHRDFDSFYGEFILVTRIMSIFALYNVNKHSMPRHWHLRKNKRFPSTHAWEPLYIKVRESFSLYHFITKFVLRFLENRCLKDVNPNANLNEGRSIKKTARSRNYLLQFFFGSDSVGVRTQDLLLRRQLL